MNRLLLKRTSRAIGSWIALAIAFAAGRASANYIYSATVKPECSSFTLSVLGFTAPPDGADVNYQVTVTPASGSPVTFADSFHVTPNAYGTIDATITREWSALGVVLGGDVAFSGTASLSTDYEHRSWSITFLPASLSCALPCTGAIGDFVWNDLDHDGIQQPDEEGINDVGLSLKDGSGAVIATTTTGGNGYYQFTRLCAGDYTVTVDEATLPPGFIATPPSAPGSTPADDSNGSPAPVNLPENGSVDESIDFGYFPQQHLQSAAIEPGCTTFTVSLAGWAIPPDPIDIGYHLALTPSAGAPLGFDDSVHVVPDGTGDFSASAARNWLAFGVTLDGTYGLSGTATLAGQAIDIVFSPASLTCTPPPPPCTGFIGDFVWDDLNHDGMQQAGEPGINGVNLTLLDGSGTVVATTTTMAGPSGADGYYRFGGLCAGSYSVTLDAATLPPGLVASPPNAPGSTTANDSNGIPASVTLATNDSSDETIDFGYFEQLACPGGGFSFAFDAAGNLHIVYDQFPAPNDNSYGINAVGWPNGHRFSDLVGSDHAGFQLVDGSGVVRLSFNIDYLTASAGAPSGYASLGPFGGDGKVLIGTLTAADISYTTSLARNLNNVNIPGLFSAAHVQQFGSVNVLVNSPPTDPQHATYTISDPLLQGWDFHDTYFVTISAAKLASLGFNANWRVEPNLDQLHNSPAKPCPPPSGGHALSVTKTEVKDRQVKITILNPGAANAIVTGLQLAWPAGNGKLQQVKLDGDVIYDNPDLLPPSATLTAAQLVADQNKRTIQHGTSDVLTFIFEKNADPDLSKYASTVNFGALVLQVLP